MVKKKYDLEDPETWNDAQINKYIIDRIHDIGVTMPWDKVVLSLVFTYAWWKAYGSGPLPTVGDVMLGITYALTIPPALQGGLVANGYAVGALGTLGVALISPPGYWEDLGDQAESNFKQRMDDVATNSGNIVDELSRFGNDIKAWYKSLPSLTPP